MKKKVWLDVPLAMKKFAEDHGATYSEEEGWSVIQRIFEESPQLWGFEIKNLPPPQKTPTPLCPKCQSYMELVPGGRGSIDYWRCHLFPSCKKTRPLEDWGSHESSTPIFRHKPKHFKEMSPKLYLKILAIIFSDLGLPIEKWFDSPKVALEGKSPAQALEAGESLILITELFLLFASDNKGDKINMGN